MKTSYRKILKISTLLISSLLIATVSAQYYRYLYISGSVTISAGGLVWVEGNDEANAISISGSTATISFSLNNGTTYNITRHLYLKNLDTSAHDITINVTDAADPTYYTTFEIRIYNNETDASITTLNALSTSSSYSGSINGQEIWHITFYIITKTDAQVSNDSFAVQFTYK